MTWVNTIIENTWKKNPQNVYNLAAIAGAVIILIVSIRLGMTYLKYDPLYLPPPLILTQVRGCSGTHVASQSRSRQEGCSCSPG
jgi:hypothetical protein